MTLFLFLKGRLTSQNQVLFMSTKTIDIINISSRTLSLSLKARDHFPSLSATRILFSTDELP